MNNNRDTHPVLRLSALLWIAAIAVLAFSAFALRGRIRAIQDHPQIEGQFVPPGIYSPSPDETLRSVVERAGGLTKQSITVCIPNI